jgi:hypothetical protein
VSPLSSFVHAWFDSKYSYPALYILPLAAIYPFLFQNRWLLIELIPTTSTPWRDHTQATTTRSPPDAISGKDVFNALKQSVLLHFGDVGWGEVGASLAGEIFFPSFARQGAESFFPLPFFFLVSSQVFFPCDEPLHRTRCAGHGNEHHLGGAGVAGQSRWGR